MKKEIAQFLQAGQEPIARIRVFTFLFFLNYFYDPILICVFVNSYNEHQVLMFLSEI